MRIEATITTVIDVTAGDYFYLSRLRSDHLERYAEDILGRSMLDIGLPLSAKFFGGKETYADIDVKMTQVGLSEVEVCVEYILDLQKGSSDVG